MPKSLAYAVFVLITAGAVYGAMQTFGERDASVAEESGELLFPGLKGAINSTGALKGVGPEGSYTLVHTDGAWLMSEKANFPADQTKVKQMLLGIAGMELREKKTRKPEKYAKLGLAEPGKDGSKAQRVTILSDNGEVMADVILGNAKVARGVPNMEEIYVRTPDEKQSWMALANIPRIVEPVDWLDDNLVQLDDQRVRKVSVDFGDGEVVRVKRVAGVGRGYELQDVPAGREIESEFVVRNVASTLTRLALDDVSKAEGELAGESPITFVIETYDGLKVSMATVKVKDDRVLRLTAEKIAAQAVPEGAQQATRDEDKVTVQSEEEVTEEVAALNKRWAGYTFELGDWRLAPSYKRMEGLLKVPETGEAGGATPATPSPLVPKN